MICRTKHSKTENKYSTMVWEQSKNSNSFKIKRNPETHQMTGEIVVIPPMEVKLDASNYKNVPVLPG